MARHPTLSLAQKAQVAEMITKGVSDENIAKAFSVHRTTILRLRRKLAIERTGAASLTLAEMARNPQAWLAEQSGGLAALQAIGRAYHASPMRERDADNRDLMLAERRLRFPARNLPYDRS